MNIYKNKKVVVTGGSGFVGTHFIQELLERGANIRTSIHNNPLKIQDDRIEVLENIDLTKSLNISVLSSSSSQGLKNS